MDKKLLIIIIIILVVIFVILGLSVAISKLRKTTTTEPYKMVKLKQNREDETSY